MSLEDISKFHGIPISTPMPTDTPPTQEDDSQELASLAPEFNSCIVGVAIGNTQVLAYSLTRLTRAVALDQQLHTEEEARKVVAEIVKAASAAHGPLAPLFIDDSMTVAARPPINIDNLVLPDEFLKTLEPDEVVDAQNIPANAILMPGQQAPKAIPKPFPGTRMPDFGKSKKRR